MPLNGDHDKANRFEQTAVSGVTAGGDIHIGQIVQMSVYLELQSVLKRLEASSKAESVGTLKAGNPHKSLAHWQGRNKEIADLHQWLSNKTPLIGIDGIGGTGKSTLAAKVYEEIDGFPKRYWADVSTGAAFSQLARQILTEFDCRVPEEESQLVTALVNFLLSGQCLLVIDNLESILQPDGEWQSQFYKEFFQTWLECGYNSSTLLVTTRERPGLKGFEWLPLKGLEIDEGAALLAELGIRGNLEDFTKLVDGHPLLIRLVADLLKDEYLQDPSLDRLADLGLGNLQQLLIDPQVIGSHRRENVGMVLVLDASFERLNASQKTLLQKVSVYRGAFDRAAAAALLSERAEEEVEGELRKLVKRSLLQEKLNGKRQFEFQPVVLEYVRYKAGDQAEAHKRAIGYFRSQRQTNLDTATTQEDAKEYLETFHHQCELQRYQAAAQTIFACNDFLQRRGYFQLLVDLYTQLDTRWQVTSDQHQEDYARLCFNLGIAYDSLGQYKRAIEYQNKSLEIRTKIGDRKGEASCLRNLGNAYTFQRDYEKAIKYQNESLKITQKISDSHGEANSLGNLGNVYTSLEDYGKAVEFYEQSLDIIKKLDIIREIDKRQEEANCRGNLGIAYYSLGQYPRAIEYQQESLDITKEISNRKGEANCRGNLGNIYAKQKNYPQAIESYEQSLKIIREIGDCKGEANCLFNLGNVYTDLEDYRQAIESYEQSLKIIREIGDCKGEANCFFKLGNIYAKQKNYPQAIDSYEHSCKITQKIGDREGEASCLFNLGNVYANQKNYPQAIDSYKDSRKITQKIGNREGEASCLFSLSNVYIYSKRSIDALQCLQQALTIYKALQLNHEIEKCKAKIARYNGSIPPL